MKVYDEVVFMDQLLHYRCVASQIEETRQTWQKRSSWYPAAQREHYSRYAEIYNESIEQYGADRFKFYSKRNRLNGQFKASKIGKEDSEVKDRLIPMDHLKGYRVPLTTNATYGRVKPSALFYCFAKQVSI
ncbi:hypothetical protein KR067_012550 [Drosophila pandora]|nr:hypothetical protein KR067_012550 [Drosophila pandora]